MAGIAARPRIPIIEANRGATHGGPAVSEEEHEATLHAERPVVDTEAVPVERVRLGKQAVTEQETIGGQVRRLPVAHCADTVLVNGLVMGAAADLSTRVSRVDVPTRERVLAALSAARCRRVPGRVISRQPAA
jgi:hypothetical protein